MHTEEKTEGTVHPLHFLSPTPIGLSRLEAVIGSHCKSMIPRGQSHGSSVNETNSLKVNESHHGKWIWVHIPRATSVPNGMWDLSSQWEIPALEGRFLAIGPPGKS